MRGGEVDSDDLGLTLVAGSPVGEVRAVGPGEPELTAELVGAATLVVATLVRTVGLAADGLVGALCGPFGADESVAAAEVVTVSDGAVGRLPVVPEQAASAMAAVSSRAAL